MKKEIIDTAKNLINGVTDFVEDAVTSKETEEYKLMLTSFQEEASKYLPIVGDVILKDYLLKISDFDVVPNDKSEDIVYFRELSSIVYEKGMPFQESMATVYSAIHSGVSQVIFLIKKVDSAVKFYIGVSCDNNNQSHLLNSALMAGFPGIKTDPRYDDDVQIRKLKSDIRNREAVAVVSGFASNRIKNQEGQFIQGIEKLIDILDDDVVIVLIADKQNACDVADVREKCEEISTAVSLNQEMNISVSASHTKAFGASVSATIGAFIGVTPAINGNIANLESGQVSYKRTDKATQQILTRIDNHLRYIAEGEDYGMWNFAAYFIGSKPSVVQVPANVYNGLIKGDNTGRSNSTVAIFDGDKAIEMCKYLAQFHHPRFEYIYKANELIIEKVIDATNIVSSKELAIQMSLPQKSLPGLLVEEQAAFGRNVISEYKSDIELQLGKIMHLGKVNNNVSVNIDIEQLRSHALITGSTGSGKSNTVYKVLQELPADIAYMVVEPAKGEYRRVIQGENVSAYGTDPRYDKLLKLNPFRFPKEIHVLAHIDRLLDIFNVCWPMYAAMPVILKESMIRAYRDCGWDLVKSTAPYNIYPTFRDVLDELRSLMNDSEYSSDTKGDYKGALEMRLSSLTNGINGLMFSGEEIPFEDLFDKRVIVDLSAVGSSETKAMIMGILILKLNEYRISTKAINSKLKHITILEEAHNILKRTSTEQSSESSNLIGKSVEMIANSIAEMRTYGEGFLIVDQSPSVLDPAAIRNTNTKIIMALPDHEDRVSVGKAAALNEKQIDALAKLKVGQAVVYQNSWQEAVLCKVDKAETDEQGAINQQKIDNNNVADIDFMNRLVNVWRDENNNLIPLKEFREDMEAITIGSANKKYEMLEYYMSRREDSANESDTDISRDDGAEILKELIGSEPLHKIQDAKELDEVEYKTLLTRELYKVIPEECQKIFANMELADMYMYNYENNYR